MVVEIETVVDDLDAADAVPSVEQVDLGQDVRRRPAPEAAAEEVLAVYAAERAAATRVDGGDPPQAEGHGKEARIGVEIDPVPRRKGKPVQRIDQVRRRILHGTAVAPGRESREAPPVRPPFQGVEEVAERAFSFADDAAVRRNPFQDVLGVRRRQGPADDLKRLRSGTADMARDASNVRGLVRQRAEADQRGVPRQGLVEPPFDAAGGDDAEVEKVDLVAPLAGDGREVQNAQRLGHPVLGFAEPLRLDEEHPHGPFRFDAGATGPASEPAASSWTAWTNASRGRPCRGRYRSSVRAPSVRIPFRKAR